MPYYYRMKLLWMQHIMCLPTSATCCALIFRAKASKANKITNNSLQAELCSVLFLLNFVNDSLLR